MIVTDLFRPLIVTEAVAAPGYNYDNVMKMPGMEKYAKKPAPVNTPNFAGPTGYSKVNTSFKSPPAATTPAATTPAATTPPAASKFERPINTGFLNPKTGRPYLPSELRAEREQEIADELSKAQQQAAAAAPSPATPAPSPATPAASTASTAVPTVPSLTSTPAKVKPLAATTTSATAPAASALPGKAPQGPGGRGSVVWTQAGRDAAAAPGTGVTSGGPATTPVASKPEPVSIGGQRINPGDPLYDKIVQNAPSGSFTATEPPPYLAAAEKTAIKNIADKAVNMLRTAQTKDDLAKVKAYIDREFAKQGNKYMSEAMFFHRDRLMEQAVRIYHRRIS